MEFESLRYIDICMQESGCEYQFYFDAFDVICILQGVNRFYSGDNHQTFKARLFATDEAIVHALALGKFLKKNIRLLPTHQSELTRIIKRDNSGTEYIFYRKSDNTLKRFLEKDLKFFDKLEYITARQTMTIDDKAIESWIDSDSKEIFKAIFLSYKAGYKDRLQELFGNEIIKIGNYGMEDIEIHDDSLFMALSNAFRHHRPGKESSGSNFSDVTALLFLARAVRDYNEDNSKPLPVYFDSHSYINYIPQDVLDAHFKLVTHMKEGAVCDTSYALRGADFFRIHALINYNSDSPVSEDQIYLGLVRSNESAEKLRENLAFSASKNGIPEIETWYTSENEKLKKKIIDYIEVDFFKTVINVLKKNRLDIINDILVSFKKQELNPESVEVINLHNELILKHITDNIDGLLRETVQMYNTIQFRIRQVIALTERLKEQNQELDIFNHYSLFRFMIPKEYQKLLKQFFSTDGLLGNSQDMSNFSRITLWNYYYRTVYYRHNKGISRNKLLNTNELYILYGTFWILNLYDNLTDFNADSKSLRPLDHSLLMLIGACIDRSIDNCQPEEEELEKYRGIYTNIIEILEQRLEEAASWTGREERDAQIKIVLAYLYFHLWRQQGNNLIVMHHDTDTEEIPYSPEAANVKAINFAREAFGYYKRKDTKSSPYFLYAFNLYIYFIIDTAPNEHFRSISALRSEFINLKGTSKYWHFRYDDTIARNFHRLSLLVQSEKSKLEYISKAVAILKDTVVKYSPLESRDIEEVRSYLGSLENIKGQLEVNLEELVKH